MSKKISEVDALAHRLAYSAACSDIKVLCTGGLVVHAVWWRDVSSAHHTDKEFVTIAARADKESVTIAVRYLTLRGLLKRHPDNNDLVQVLPEP